MVLSVGVRLVVGHEVDELRSPVSFDDEDFLALRLYQVWLAGRLFFNFDLRAFESLDEDSG
jgi:hypothetical protein